MTNSGKTLPKPMPKPLRILFASLIQFCNVTEPFRLWDTSNGDLTEDFVRSGDTPFDAKQRASSHIQQLLPKQLSEYNLPDPLPQPRHFQTQNTINNIEAFENTGQMRNTLTADQQRLCGAVWQSVRDSCNVQLIGHRLYSLLTVLVTKPSVTTT